MAKVLLTGGSGFVATHVLQVLLERGYNVVATVRSTAKGDKILAAYPNISKERLSYALVDDIAQEGAFEQAFQSDRPFDYIIHTASPFPTSFEDPVKDVLDPAINGTTGILKAARKHAPSVKRVVVTSSFASIVNTVSPPRVYNESSWNPVTWDEAVADPSLTYRGSKTFAEKAAWDFIAKEKPTFDLVTLCPPLVYGPVAHHLSSLSHLNTSNQRIRDFIQGKHTTSNLSPTGTHLWVDVRDLALAHVRALEVPEAGGNRFFVVAGHCSNKWIVDVIRKKFPQLKDQLPSDPVDDFPKDCYGYDNEKVRDLLGIQFRNLEEGIEHTVQSLLELKDSENSSQKL